MKNQVSLDTLCASLSYAMGIEPPSLAQSGEESLKKFVDDAFDGQKADRVFMYNPDAIAQWIYEKYPQLMKEAIDRADLRIPFCTVMPSVTPVCFGTMYTGVQPSVHGIRSYTKPVITVDTIFDALIRAGKKPVIIAEDNCSLAKIYLERNMDYFIYDTIEEVNAKAAEIILKDEYDFIVVYNGNYDSVMHKHGPESVEALSELRANSEVFGIFSALIEEHWKNHNTLVGFAMDHGCHEIDGSCGSHGLDMDEDLNIVHLYKAYSASK
ncbi:MAG: alkaline phosphatase family protein [Clostridia bacterium]|nr:alkaline phosphatase family protein [Clostridia bacterium]